MIQQGRIYVPGFKHLLYSTYKLSTSISSSVLKTIKIAFFANMASRTELSFKKMLSRCETMAKDRNSGEWRFEKVDCVFETICFV